MKYDLTYGSHTWSFATANNLEFKFPEPLTIPKLVAAVPEWVSIIPERLMIAEPGDDMTCRNFKNFLEQENGLGAIAWHLFKYTAYHLPIDNNVQHLTKAAVVTSLNTSGNKIMYVPGIEMQELIEQMFDSKGSYGFDKPKSHVLGRPLATMFVRLFNYYECYERNLPNLFHMVPRNSPAATCPACQTVFNHAGKILTPPSVDVDVETWQDDFALPGGFGWFPGSDEGTGFERQRKRRD